MVMKGYRLVYDMVLESDRKVEDNTLFLFEFSSYRYIQLNLKLWYLQLSDRLEKW